MKNSGIGKRHGLFNIKDQTQMKVKILKMMLLSIILVVLFTSSIAIAMFYRTTMETLKTLLTNSAMLAANNVSTTLDAKLGTVEEFASRAYFIQDTRETSEIARYCEEFAARQGYLSANYADKDGNSTGGKNISDRDYFQQCKATGKSVISDLILSKDNGESIVVLAAPVMKNGVFDGIIIAQANAGFLSDLTRGIKIGTTGSSYMLDSKGNTIAHDDINNVLNAVNTIEAAKTDGSMARLASVHRKMLESVTGFDTYSYNGSLKMIGYAPVGINGWSIGLGGETMEYLDSVYISIALIIVLAVAAIVIVVLLSMRKIREMVTPLKLCSDRIVLLGRGDLTTPFPQIDSRDEIGLMAQAAQEMISRLSTMITDVDYILGEMAEGNFDTRSRSEESYQGDFAGILSSSRTLNRKLSETLRQIDDGSSQVALGSTQMAQSAQSLAEGATEQAGAVEELTATIASVSSLVADSAGKAQAAYSQAKGYRDQAEHSSEEMQELIRAMESINATSHEIENIIAEIESIATQTNLLSLNASIEAARAGEAGRGFAVVADQIGKLASDSAKSAVSTRELISKSVNEISNGNEIASRTAAALEQVISGINTLAVSSREISDMAVSQAETMNQIESGVEQISGVIQNNSASAEETSATSQELSAQSENLKALVGQFRLRVE